MRVEGAFLVSAALSGGSVTAPAGPAADMSGNDALAGDLRAASLHQHVCPAVQAAKGLEAECARPGDQPVIDALPLVP